MDKIKVSGITTSMNVAKILIEGVEDRPGAGFEIFSLLGEAGINVELISQAWGRGGHANISFVVLESETAKTLDLIRKEKKKLKIKDVSQDPRAAVITVYSDTLGSTPGVASRVFKSLSAKGVNIDIVSTSLNSVSVVVARDQCSEGLSALKDAFDVGDLREGEGPG